MILLSMLLISCSPPAAPPDTTSAPLIIQTTSFPVDYLTRRLVGSHGAVTCILPPGEDPATWQPSGERVAALAEADLIFANGASLEAWMKTASLPERRVVRSADDLPLITRAGRTHSHGSQGMHSHAGTDPHTWADPSLYRQQAPVLHDALAQARPEDRADFDDALQAIDADLSALEADLGEALAPLVGVPLVSSHPAFDYLARRYTLTLHALDLDPQQPPSPAALAELAEHTGDGPALPLWESPPSASVKSAFPPSTQHIYVDPLEQPAGSVYDYIAQSRHNIQTFTALAAEVTARGAGEPEAKTPPD